MADELSGAIKTEIVCIKQAAVIEFLRGECRELRQKLAIAGVEGSPPPGEETTINSLLRRVHESERDRTALRTALERLASTESFTVAFDAKFAAPETLWAELRARGEFAKEAALLGKGDGHG